MPDRCFCPFCKTLSVHLTATSTGQWAMTCDECGAHGPVSDEDSTAYERWVETVSADQLLRTVIDESPDIILMKDWDGRFLLGNRALAQLYGTTPEELVGHDDGAFNPNADQVAFYLENVRSVMRSGRTQIVMESSTDVESGETRYFQSIKKPLTGPQGDNRILVIAHDITEIQRAREQIEARERSYSYAMAAAGDGIWDWDLGTDVVTHNAKWCELFGLGTETLSHPIDIFMELLYPDDRSDVEDALRQALASDGEYRHEHRMVRQDGSVLHVLDRGRVVERDDAGHPTRMAGAVTDITDAVLAHERIRVTTEALIDANLSLERKVEERTAALAKANTNLRELAWRDALTKLPNRLAGLERIREEHGRIGRGGSAAILLMMDVDHFKDINDNFGHPAGDHVLQQVADVIRNCLRVGDFIARFGGEEFLALLPRTDPEGARIVAEKIRVAIEASVHSPNGPVTISIGGTLATDTDDDIDLAVRRADAALYEAKRAGRNCVVIWPAAPGQHTP